MTTITCRLSPKAARTLTDAGFRVTKTTLRLAITDNPRMELINAAFGPTYLSVEEVGRHGGGTINLRYNDDRDVAVIEVQADGQWVLS